MYGLQRAWHQKITEFLVAIGFCMSEADHSLYVRKSDAGFVFIIIYVDYLIIGGDTLSETLQMKMFLEHEFDIRTWVTCIIFWALRSFIHLKVYG